jgi:hypothetical protein
LPFSLIEDHSCSFRVGARVVGEVEKWIVQPSPTDAIRQRNHKSEQMSRLVFLAYHTFFSEEHGEETKVTLTFGIEGIKTVRGETLGC